MRAVLNFFKSSFPKLFIAGSIFAVIIFVIGYFILTSSLPDVDKLKEYAPPLTTKIYDATGEIILETGKEKRELATLEEIPKIVVESFISAEDNNFYEHDGVDYLGVIRATFANLKAGRVVQGGSTITQQVAKSLLLTRERSIKRKIKDFILAQRIEEKFSKQEILYLYLNQVYLGGGYYGVKAAVRGYFGKELKETTVAEAALLAGLLVAPGRYSPYNNPQYAKKRQIYVLGRLYADGKISKEEYEAAKVESINLLKKRESILRATYFTDWVRQRVIDLVGEDAFLTDGFEVQTTLNLKLQEEAERAVRLGVRDIDKRQGYKGPVEKLETDQILPWLLGQRKEMLIEQSTMLIFGESGAVAEQYEMTPERVTFLEEELKKQFAEDDKESKYYGTKVVVGNTIDSQQLIDSFEAEIDHKAVVIGYNNTFKLIYVDLGAIRGIIEYDDFKWAKKRLIAEERTDRREIQFPSEVVKVGDVVLVKFNSTKLKKFESFTPNEFGARLNPADFKKFSQEQKFYSFKLEQDPVVQSGLAAINPYNGHIVALVGGSDFSKSQFNRAIQANRQTGSAFKPFIYAAALEHGYTPVSILVDTPQALAGFDESALDWKPRNYDGQFLGLLTLRQCLEQSRNVPTITLLQQIGIPAVASFLNRNGIKLKDDEDLSLALGSFGFNLLDIVRLYSVFPNGGKGIRTKSILSIKNNAGEEFFTEEMLLGDEDLAIKEGAEGHEETTTATTENKEPEVAKKTEGTEGDKKPPVTIDFISHLKEGQVYDSRLAYLMTQLLTGVVQNGTGRNAASISPFIGGKTGTTNNYVDAWFVGFTNNLVAGVWTGFDDNTTLGFGETGARAALPIWSRFIKRAIEIRGHSNFTAPKGVVNVLIDPTTGKKATNTLNAAHLLREYFVEGTEPGGKYAEDKKYDDLGIIDDDDYFDSQ